MSLKALGWATLFSTILWAAILLPFLFFGPETVAAIWFFGMLFVMTVVVIADQMEKWRNQ